MAKNKYSPIVEVGAGLLDKHDVAWVDLIDLNVLEIRSVRKCVLGQVFADDSRATDNGNGFIYGRRQLGFNRSTSLTTLFDAGFTVGAFPYAVHSLSEEDAEFDLLREAWIDLINTRRGRQT